jgi:hypothetical protein
MSIRIRNPHPFDMSDFYHGQIVVLGGRDLEREESVKNPASKDKEKNKSHDLDWSFLKKKPSPKRF